MNTPNVPKPPEAFKVLYKFLTGKECEELKEAARDKEDQFFWKTYGENRDQELDRIPISQLSTQHLENILITQPQITPELAAAILMLLKKRWKV